MNKIKICDKKGCNNITRTPDVKYCSIDCAATDYDFLINDKKKQNKIPFISVGNNELKDNKKLKKGNLIDCPHCLKKHKVELGKTSDGVETDSLMFYKCGKNLYLCGVDGVSLSASS